MMFSDLRPGRAPFAICAMASLLMAGNALSQEVLNVEFVKAALREMGTEVRLTGTLEPLVSLDIGFREGGKIIEVLVSEGDRFLAGQVLAQVDSLQAEQAQKAALATVDSARAAENQARQAADRAQALLDRGVGTRAARDEARRALSEAEAASKRAASALDQTRRSVEDTSLFAPFDGVVTARNGEPGQVVGEAQAVLSLAGLGGIEAVFMTPDLPNLGDAMGSPVALTMFDVSAPPMTARITEISPLIDATTGSVRLRARVEDAPDDVALLGASVRGEMTLGIGRAVEVPWTALTSTGGKPAVWVVSDAGTSELREVEIARFDDSTVLLSEGVEDGEVVVGAGSQLLFPGREIADTGADR